MFSHINISVVFTHAFKIKSFTNMFMWIIILPIKRHARTYFIIKFVNCTQCSWSRKYSQRFIQHIGMTGEH